MVDHGEGCLPILAKHLLHCVAPLALGKEGHAHCMPMFAQIGPLLVEIAQIRCPMLVNYEAVSAIVGPNLVEFGRCLAKVAQVLDTVDPERPNLGRCRPEIWPEGDRFGPGPTKPRPNSTKLGPETTKPDFDKPWRGFDQICGPSSAKLAPPGRRNTSNPGTLIEQSGVAKRTVPAGPLAFELTSFPRCISPLASLRTPVTTLGVHGGRPVGRNNTNPRSMRWRKDEPSDASRRNDTMTPRTPGDPKTQVRSDNSERCDPGYASRQTTPVFGRAPRPALNRSAGAARGVRSLCILTTAPDT